MSQYQSDDFRQHRSVVLPTSGEKTKGWTAGLAFLLSMLFFVPFAPLLALVLGLSARRRSPALAGCAVMLGLVFSLGQAFVGYRGYEYYEQLTGGPGQALGAGFTGNFAAFNDAFLASTPAGDLEAQAFVEELETRYGRLLDVQLLDPISEISGPESLTAPRRYELVFKNMTLQAEAAIGFDRRVSRNWLKSNLAYLEVHDPDRGDMTFPASESQQLVSQPTDR